MPPRPCPSGPKSDVPAACLRTPQSETHLVPPGSVPSAFHRVLQRPPLRRQNRWCPLPRTGVRFGRGLPSLRHVPPSWSLTTLTASSTSDPWACCIPLPTMRFTGLQPPEASMRPLRDIPHGAIPSRAFPSPTAAPPSPGSHAPLPFTSPREGARLRGLHPSKSPLPASVVADDQPPVALLGFRVLVAPSVPSDTVPPEGGPAVVDPEGPRLLVSSALLHTDIARPRAHDLVEAGRSVPAPKRPTGPMRGAPASRPCHVADLGRFRDGSSPPEGRAARSQAADDRGRPDRTSWGCLLHGLPSAPTHRGAPSSPAPWVARDFPRPSAHAAPCASHGRLGHRGAVARIP